MLSAAPYTFPAMQDASTLLHSHSYDLKERPHTDDEEMTSCSDGSSQCDSFGDTDTTPETSLEPDEVNDGKLHIDHDLLSNQPMAQEDELMDEDEAGEESFDIQPKLSEWESQGGLTDINSAFEGSMLFDATLEEIAAWCAPLVWKLFLRQEP